MFFFKSKMLEKQQGKKQNPATPSTTFSNVTNTDNKSSQLSYKSILKNFVNNFSLFIIGTLFSIFTCFLLITLTYLLRRSFNIVDYKINRKNISFNIEQNISQIYMNCNFCYLAVWSTTSFFSLIFPFFLFFHSLTTKCFNTAAPNDSKLKSMSRFVISSLHFFSSSSNPNKKNEKSDRIEPLKLKDFCVKILLTTLLWITTGLIRNNLRPFFRLVIF